MLAINKQILSKINENYEMPMINSKFFWDYLKISKVFNLMQIPKLDKIKKIYL